VPSEFRVNDPFRAPVITEKVRISFSGSESFPATDPLKVELLETLSKSLSATGASLIGSMIKVRVD